MCKVPLAFSIASQLSFWEYIVEYIEGDKLLRKMTHDGNPNYSPWKKVMWLMMKHKNVPLTPEFKTVFKKMEDQAVKDMHNTKEYFKQVHVHLNFLFFF